MMEAPLMVEEEKPVYRRILLKLSGEALMRAGSYGIDAGVLRDIAGQISEVHKMGVQIALVIGGGTYSAGSRPPRKEWTAPLPTIWGFLRR